MNYIDVISVAVIREKLSKMIISDVGSLIKELNRIEKSNLSNEEQNLIISILEKDSRESDGRIVKIESIVVAAVGAFFSNNIVVSLLLACYVVYILVKLLKVNNEIIRIRDYQIALIASTESTENNNEGIKKEGD